MLSFRTFSEAAHGIINKTIGSSIWFTYVSPVAGRAVMKTKRGAIIIDFRRRMRAKTPWLIWGLDIHYYDGPVNDFETRARERQYAVRLSKDTLQKLIWTIREFLRMTDADGICITAGPAAQRMVANVKSYFNTRNLAKPHYAIARWRLTELWVIKTVYTEAEWVDYLTRDYSKKGNLEIL